MGVPRSTNKSTLVVDFSTVGGKANPLNPLGLRLRKLIWQALDDAEKNSSIGSVILYGGGSSSRSSNNFSAGADLTEFGRIEKSTKSDDGNNQFYPLVKLITKIENFPKPIVAAIRGNALGGGLEVCLSCHYRIADSSGRFGLPEVNVGVIPGAGGTQRLPRLITVPKALEMILTGKSIGANDAKKIGLIDRIVFDSRNANNVNSGDCLIEHAKKFASWAELMPLDDRRVGSKRIKESDAQLDYIIETASKKLPPVDSGGESVWAALEAVKACRFPIDEGSAIELKQFFKTLSGSQGIARRHTFFAVRKAQKMIVSVPPSNGRSHPLLTKSRSNKLTEVAVVGAGLMGSGIAMVLLQAGFKVHLLDVYKESLEKGLLFLRSTIKSYVKRGKLSENRAGSLLKLLTPTQKFEDLSNCSLVVEAVVENMTVKKKIFHSLDKITPRSCILLSNTSTLDIDEMASSLSTSRRALFAGWHFFSPAHVMKLVEIVAGTATSTETTCVMQQLTKRIGKIGVVVGNCDGFVGNRLLISYGIETGMLLEEGVASISSVDKAILKFGIALGPFQMADMAGLDVGYNIRKARGWVSNGGAVSKNRPVRYPEIADIIVSEYKRLGQKSGKGWYDYDKKIGKGRKSLPSAEVNELITKYSKKGQTPFSEQQIIERVLFPMVNEGFKCLEEGIARQPSDIDVVYIYGYGWPAYKGGPMWWADQVGLDYILKRLEEFSLQFPKTSYYVPSELLKRCVMMRLSAEEYFNLGLFKKQTKELSKL